MFKGDVEQTEKSTTVASSNLRSYTSEKREAGSKNTLPVKKGFKPTIISNTITVIGEIEQTTKPTAVVSNTRSLRSARNEAVSKEVLPARKQLKSKVSNDASELPAGSSGTASLTTNTTSLVQHVSTRSSNTYNTKSSGRRDSESAVCTSTPRKRHGVADQATDSQLSAGSSDTLRNSKLHSTSLSLASTSRLGKRRHALHLPVQKVWKASKCRDTDSQLSTGLLHNLRNRKLPSASLTLSNTQSRLRNKRHASPLPVRKGLKPAMSHSASELPSGNSGTVSLRSLASLYNTKSSARHDSKCTVNASTPRKRRDVGVQAADSHSSASSQYQLRHGRLHSTSSSLASTSPKRHNNAVVESCSSSRTVVTAKSSVQSDTYYDAATSHVQDDDDIDDAELDRLARLAHGSPQSTIPVSSDNRTITESRPTQSHDSGTKLYSPTQLKQPLHVSMFSRKKSSAVRSRQTAAVVDDMTDLSVDSDGAYSSPENKRREINEKEDEKQSPKSGRTTSQLIAGDGKKPVKSALKTGSVAAASLQHREVDRSGVEVTSYRMEKSSVEPVAGPSGTAHRTENQNESKNSLASSSGKN